MTKKKNLFSRVKLVYRHSPLLLKCAVLATIVLSTVALTTLRLNITQYQSQTQLLREQAAQVEQENRQLQEDLALLDTVEGVKRVATSQLGLVDPDTVFYSVGENQN